jgi:hypothetical protein
MESASLSFLYYVLFAADCKLPREMTVDKSAQAKLSVTPFASTHTFS